jgi:hypothetical protein
MSADGARRGRVVRSGRRLAVMGAAAAFTVLLAQHTTTAAFTAQTGDTGNTASTAATFCTTPGGTTVGASADTTAYQQNPTTAYGTSAEVGVGSSSGANGRVFVKFALPALAARCTVTAATLRMHAHTPAASRTIDVYRVDPGSPAWSEASTNWNNQPAGTGTAASSASLASGGWQEWSVTSIVTSFYAGTNSGFLVRDRAESSGSAYWQLYGARENGTAANRPQLVLSWG